MKKNWVLKHLLLCTIVDHLGELERPGAVEVEKDMILTENMKQGDGRDTAQAHEGIWVHLTLNEWDMIGL